MFVFITENSTADVQKYRNLSLTLCTC